MLTGYIGTAEKVVIPEGVTAIADDVFFDNETLTEVVFPNSLKTIGNASFYSTKLTLVTIPEGVTSIGEWAFVVRSGSLKYVNIPKSVNEIGEVAFNPIEAVYYAGTESEWNEINIGNEAFEGAIIHYESQYDPNQEPDIPQSTWIANYRYDKETGRLSWDNFNFAEHEAEQYEPYGSYMVIYDNYALDYVGWTVVKKIDGVLTEPFVNLMLDMAYTKMLNPDNDITGTHTVTLTAGEGYSSGTNSPADTYEFTFNGGKTLSTIEKPNATASFEGFESGSFTITIKGNDNIVGYIYKIDDVLYKQDGFFVSTTFSTWLEKEPKSFSILSVDKDGNMSEWYSPNISKTTIKTYNVTKDGDLSAVINDIAKDVKSKNIAESYNIFVANDVKESKSITLPDVPIFIWGGKESCKLDLKSPSLTAKNDLVISSLELVSGSKKVSITAKKKLSAASSLPRLLSPWARSRRSM